MDASVAQQHLKAMTRRNVTVLLKDGSQFVGAASGIYASGLQAAARFETPAGTIRISYDQIDQIILPDE
jgi:hypothetical protein